jgi:ketol-acid reductoisomerase
MNLLSDAAQSQTWPTIAPLITKGKTLYFSHGFSIVYKEDTKVIAPPDVDVILVAPKGSGRTVRTLFKEGRGINSSVAVFQDVTGKAKEKAIALGVGIGSGYMYDTTFEKEVYSDLYGERGVVRTNSLRSKSEILTRFCSSWAPSVCFFCASFQVRC